jgi:site-specific DNA recombinase
MEKAEKVSAYIRVSTEKQGESGLGLEAQRQAITLYCMLYKREIVGWYEDQQSAKTAARPALKKAMAAKLPIVVAKLDRLTRSLTDLATIASQHEVISVAENIDSTNASGRLIINLLGSVAQWEREAVGERVSAALQAKKKRGERIGRPPYGLRSEGHGNFLPHEEERALIRDVRRMRGEGRTLVGICDALNKSGRLTRSGCLWTKQSLHKMLLLAVESSNK